MPDEQRVSVTDDKGIPILAFMERILDERDRQYDARFRAAEIAVSAAFAAQKESVGSAFLASEKAIVKAEEAQKAYNAIHNDLSRKMDEQYKLMIPRSEFDRSLTDLRQRLEAGDKVALDRVDQLRDIFTKEIAALREAQSANSGRSGGFQAGWGILLGAVSLIGTLLAIGIGALALLGR